MDDLEYTQGLLILVDDISPVGLMNTDVLSTEQCHILHNDLPAHIKHLCQFDTGDRRIARLQNMNDLISTFFSTQLFLPHAPIGCRFFKEISMIGAECVSAPLET